MVRIVRSSVVLASLVALGGCGGGDAPRLVSVTGKVVHKGQPLTGGTVWFLPENANTFQGEPSSCKLKLDGSFVMQTYPYGDGVPPGTYKVTLGNDLANRIKLPSYANAAKTPLSIEIPEAGLSETVLEIK